MSSAPPFRMTTATSHDESKSNVQNITSNPDSAIQHNASSSSAQPPVHFRTNTIAPSPPPSQIERHNHGDGPKAPSAADIAHHSPQSALRISTDVSVPTSTSPSLAHGESLGRNTNLSPSRVLNNKASTSSLQPMSRTPSLKAALTNSLGSAGGTNSAITSPVIAAMGDMTPLPSPLLSGDSPGPWKRLSSDSASPPQTRGRLRSMGEASMLITTSGEPIEVAAANASRRKLYATFDAANNGPAPVPQDQPQPQQPRHVKNRSTSEYVPDPMAAPTRPVTVSGSHFKIDTMESQETCMRRELNFAESRGLTSTVTQPPTPPPSESSKDSGDGNKPKDPGCEYFDARARGDRKKRRWRSLGYLGQGTFSRVMLATSQMVPDGDSGEPSAGPMSPVTECHVDRKKLVAVKVCEHGPRGGASEERVEMSLKRELEIMQNIHHPSLVNLKAWSIEHTRAILVLSYCPGGDLFEVATGHRHILTPPLLRRIFAELVGAVGYLHEMRIVHRDVKLENVLVNLAPSELADPTVDWTTFPHSIVTLADLGLSRRVSDDEKLETRCGSDDYAAPEVIMGQPYDGRATDAWSLGVLLYALLEARLPFDPHPGMSDAHRMRSRTSHRIARVEWRWVEYNGDDGDHEGSVAKFDERGLLGAMEITEGLLKRARSRWSIGKVAAQPWVRDALKIDGGLQFREEEVAEEV
ncbi:Serine/threonine-protein kinase PRR1 [Tolypocladium ophioglossoides CBS 100239]|uniref:Serine/threonine-protein kinase PRR1 n=1 Tax=Tolypocladium ophioglossoides (strain CBS 100239) TaxID=1163406 RepID=A0A0L0NCI4_TOLOC|nr:Serine/threonine-protein kinase PRR1 [Tolypocladium ophioglossoides CBS 100239]